MVTIKSEREIELMREAGRILAKFMRSLARVWHRVCLPKKSTGCVKI